MARTHREPEPLPALRLTDSAGRPLPWPTFRLAPPQAQGTTSRTGRSRGWGWRTAPPREALRSVPSSALKGLVLALFAAGILFGLVPAHAWWLDGPRWLLGLLAVGTAGLLLGLDAALALVLLVALVQAAPGIAGHPLPALLVAVLALALRIGWDWLPAWRAG